MYLPTCFLGKFDFFFNHLKDDFKCNSHMIQTAVVPFYYHELHKSTSSLGNAAQAAQETDDDLSEPAQDLEQSHEQ